MGLELSTSGSQSADATHLRRLSDQIRDERSIQSHSARGVKVWLDLRERGPTPTARNFTARVLKVVSVLAAGQDLAALGSVTVDSGVKVVRGAGHSGRPVYTFSVVHSRPMVVHGRLWSFVVVHGRPRASDGSQRSSDGSLRASTRSPWSSMVVNGRQRSPTIVIKADQRSSS